LSAINESAWAGEIKFELLSLMFLLDTIFSLGRQHFSTAQIKLILWLLTQLGVSGVPSFKKLRKTQAAVRVKVQATELVESKAALGTHFHVLDIGQAFAMVRP
ncbi:hypothetical protein B9479_007988, partial [Cryptococcus floricola]